MKKPPVIFDIDGTLTSEYYNFNNLLSLKENPAMVLVAIALQAERPLIVSTARPEFLRGVTELWLSKHGLVPEKVYMRPNNQEGVPDPEIKLAHLRTIQEQYGQPIVWVDDNLGVLSMLKENKVPIIAVTSI